MLLIGCPFQIGAWREVARAAEYTEAKNENTRFMQEARKGTRQALTDGSFITSVGALFN
jgi:hypothetical protein